MFHPKWEIFKKNLSKRKRWFIAWIVPLIILWVSIILAFLDQEDFVLWKLISFFVITLLSSFWITVPDILFSEKIAKKIFIIAFSIWYFLLLAMILLPLIFR